MLIDTTEMQYARTCFSFGKITPSDGSVLRIFPWGPGIFQEKLEKSIHSYFRQLHNSKEKKGRELYLSVKSILHVKGTLIEDTAN